MLSALLQKRFPQGFFFHVYNVDTITLFKRSSLEGSPPERCLFLLSVQTPLSREAPWHRRAMLMSRSPAGPTLELTKAPRYNLDKAAHALTLRNICVVKPQRLHGASSAFWFDHAHFSCLLTKPYVFFYLEYAPDLPMPCKWVTQTAECLSSRGSHTKTQEALWRWCQIRSPSNPAPLR